MNPIQFETISFGKLYNHGLCNHIQSHYEELNDGAFPLEPDWNRYFNLEKMDMLRCYAAYDGSEMVGYAIFLVSPNMHYSTSTWGMEDLYYLAPAYRTGSTGYKFLKFFLTDIEKQVDKVIMGTKVKYDIGVLLRRLGYTHFENLYSKLGSK